MGKYTKDDFVQKAILVHGGKYCYEKSAYEGSTKKIGIVCRDHGEFFQVASSHLEGRGCRECGLLAISEKRSATKEWFIDKAVTIHGDRYSYDKVVFVSTTEKVIITCKLHGDFLMQPTVHYRGSNCSKCAVAESSAAQMKPVDEFIKQAILVHGDTYEYKPDQYDGRHGKIEIICSKHGVFRQTPAIHLRGSACPKCAEKGFNPRKRAHLYLLKSKDESIVKVGISGNTEKRFSDLARETPFDFSVIGLLEIKGEEARGIEREILSRYVSAGLSGFSGCTEWMLYDNRIVRIFNEGSL